MASRRQAKGNPIPGERATPESLLIESFRYNFWNKKVERWLKEDWQLEKYRIHSSRSMTPSKYIDFSYLSSQDIEEEVMSLLNGIGWAHALSDPHKTYTGLTLEFYSTYKEYSNRGRVTAISFQMCGKQLWMPVTQLAEIFGFDASCPSDEKKVKEAHSFSLRDTWEELGIVASRVTKVPRATMLTYLAHKYIHRLLSTTICGRGDSTGNVGDGDCFLLFCMMRGIKLDGTPWLLKMFNRISAIGAGKVCGGGFITAIALSLGFREDETRLPPMSNDFLLGSAMMKRVKEQVQDPKGKGKKVVEEEEEEEEEGEEECEEEEVEIEEKRQVLSVDGVNVYTRLRRARSLPSDLSDKARGRILDARKKKKMAVDLLKTMARWVRNIWSEHDKDEMRELKRHESKRERRTKGAHDQEAGASNH